MLHDFIRFHQHPFTSIECVFIFCMPAWGKFDSIGRHWCGDLAKIHKVYRDQSLKCGPVASWWVSWPHSKPLWQILGHTIPYIMYYYINGKACGVSSFIARHGQTWQATFPFCCRLCILFSAAVCCCMDFEAVLFDSIVAVGGIYIPANSILCKGVTGLPKTIE